MPAGLDSEIGAAAILGRFLRLCMDTYEILALLMPAGRAPTVGAVSQPGAFGGTSSTPPITALAQPARTQPYSASATSGLCTPLWTWPSATWR